MEGTALPVAVFNVDATKRPAAINDQEKLLRHLRTKTPFAAPVSVYTEVSSKLFAQRLAGAMRYNEHEFARYDRTVQIFEESAGPPAVSHAGKYLCTPLRVGGQTVLLYSVHLSRKSAATRQRQFDLLLRSVDELRGDAHEVVVAGDFNAKSEDVAAQFAGTGLLAAVRPGDAPTAKSGTIDNVLTSAPIRGTARWKNSLFTHTPLCVTLDIQK